MNAKHVLKGSDSTLNIGSRFINAWYVPVPSLKHARNALLVLYYLLALLLLVFSLTIFYRNTVSLINSIQRDLLIAAFPFEYLSDVYVDTTELPVPNHDGVITLNCEAFGTITVVSSPAFVVVITETDAGIDSFVIPEPGLLLSESDYRVAIGYTMTDHGFGFEAGIDRTIGRHEIANRKWVSYSASTFFPTTEETGAIRRTISMYIDMTEAETHKNGLSIFVVFIFSLSIPTLFFGSLRFANRWIRPVVKDWEDGKSTL